ncbi:hypothetical protein OHC33_000932 [Knufia fluminis]|uniref:Uncharacterized protein n=1 Tax=Knufia fluminis TaxID=191047 RepID=A0AAN8ES89_9EURO|nr:hypothetical protein OHC33_000932 [Knufia fluminis]
MPRRTPPILDKERSPPRQTQLSQASPVPGNPAEAPPPPPIQSIYPVPGEAPIIPQPTYSETILQTPILATDSSSLPPQQITPGPSSATSRRRSSSSMRNASMNFENIAPSATPTGRISKAKKGKRVHACEFPGCGKVRLIVPSCISYVDLARCSPEQNTEEGMSSIITQTPSIGVLNLVVVDPFTEWICYNGIRNGSKH